VLPNAGLPSPFSITDFAVGQNQNNYLQVFVAGNPVGSSARAVYTVQQASLGGLWGTWSSLGSPNPNLGLTLHVARNQTNDSNNGTLEVFACDGQNLYQLAQQGANNDDWTHTTWGSLGAPSPGNGVASFAIGQNKDGRLEVFVIMDDGTLYHDWQNSPAGSWSDWDALVSAASGGAT
jgi:hypothetical protein